MQRRTKIVATLGPAVDQPLVLREFLGCGVDVVRVNMSHGSHQQHGKRIQMVREVAAQLERTVGVLLDLQGPKIRIACFQRGLVELQRGQSFILDASFDPKAGNEKRVGLDYLELPKQVHSKDILLLDDGRLILQVEAVEGTQVVCQVLQGGKLSDHKGLNRQGGGLAAPALTDKDRQDILFAAEYRVDYIAVSFPKSAQDLQEARQLLNAAGCRGYVVAKIERAEAIQNLDEVILASDAVMVARGDLGVELGFAELPGIQKHIIARANALDKAVITATQMMESMIHHPIPTRAEVSDVANAVLDGTDAVMLSAETATGRYPVEVIRAIEDICKAAERQKAAKVVRERDAYLFSRVDEAIAMAAIYMANHVDIKAIIALTESGSTPLWMSRMRSNIPIYALSRHEGTRARVTLFKGVYPIAFDVTQFPRWEVTVQAVKELAKRMLVQEGDRVIVTKGDVLGVDGGANALKIVTVDMKTLDQY